MNINHNLYDITRNREVIFIEAIKELHQRIRVDQKTPYNLVRKGAILRLLIIDGSKLYQTINKNYRLKLTMLLKGNYRQVSSLASFENPRSNYIIANFQIDENGDEFDIPKFLKQPIIKITNPHLRKLLDKKHISEQYDINDLIKLIANAHGGVHFENWGEDVPQFIMTDDSSPFNINSNSQLHKTLNNISELIINTLEPLSTAVSKNLKKTKPIAFETSTIVSVEKR